MAARVSSLNPRRKSPFRGTVDARVAANNVSRMRALIRRTIEERNQ